MKSVEQREVAIAEALGNVIVRFLELPQGAFVSVARVILDAEQKNAKVHLSVIPPALGEDVIRAFVAQRSVVYGEIRRFAEIKPMPNFRYTTEEYVDEAQFDDRIWDGTLS